jgi:methanogenic corrinoid protein MtbC1
MHQPTQPDRVRDDYLTAVLEPDPFRAREVVRGAADAGAPIEVLYHEVLEAAMAEVGLRWESGEITIAHEHLAAEVTVSLVAELATRVRTRPSSGRLAVVSCTPGERHCIGGLMLAGLLEAEGWEVLFLGATLPLDDLVLLAESEAPDVVALSTTIADNLPRAREAVMALRDLDEPPLVAVGGQAYAGEPEARDVGADLWAPSARDAPALVRERVPPL